jgi:adenylylsulfate kinase
MKINPAFVVWITGFPGSGKSVRARALADKLLGLGIKVQILESDALREVLTPHPTYSLQERDAFYGSMVHIGWLLVENGINVIFDATANRRRYREAAREKIDKFIEVYVRCPLEVCMQRDPKGIYTKAKTGQANMVPGIQVAYEEPLNPEVITSSVEETPEASSQNILQKLKALSFI